MNFEYMTPFVKTVQEIYYHPKMKGNTQIANWGGATQIII